MALPPGPTLPAAAQTALWLADPIAFLERAHRRYGDVFTFETILFGREVNVVRPEAIRQIFTGDPDVMRAGEANTALGPLLGPRSVLLLDGAEHLRHRRLLLPPFHGERMLAYARIMRDCAAQAMARFPIDRPFALHPHMQRITLEIILRTVFGVDEGARMDEFARAVTTLLDRIQSPLASLALAPAFQKSVLGLSPWDVFLRDRERADALIYKQIARRRDEIAGGAPRRDDILSLLLDARDETGAGLTDLELRDELMTLLVAGHETTATMLCWSFELILADARVHDRLLGEIDAGADPQKNEYLDAVVKEVLRHRPVIPAVGRVLGAPAEIGGFELPAGVLVVPSIYLTHHLPDIYPEPHAFRPERFLGKKTDPHAFLPFGGGARRCLGMAFALFEMKVVLSTVLASVRLRKASFEVARVVPRSFTFAPAGGARVVCAGARARDARRASPDTAARTVA
jgi:cytochrome P450